MAKPNYAFEKRQRELAKKRKKEEKAARKGSPDSNAPDGGPEPAVTGGSEGTSAPESGAQPDPAS